MAIETIAGAADPEGTAYPFWIIVNHHANGQIVFQAGVWFSREAAEKHLLAKKHHYSKKAVVWCASGHMSADYRKVYDASKQENEKIQALRLERENIMHGDKCNFCGGCHCCGCKENPDCRYMIDFGFNFQKKEIKK